MSAAELEAARRERQFVDTNVLVYAHDGSAGEKRDRAASLLADLWGTRAGCLSLQVLQEFFVTVTRETRRLLSSADATARLVWYAEWIVHEPTRQDLISAVALHHSLRVSFWDAMILQSARQLGCAVLWTEDLSHGQLYGGVTARNPFLA